MRFALGSTLASLVLAGSIVATAAPVAAHAATPAHSAATTTGVTAHGTTKGVAHGTTKGVAHRGPQSDTVHGGARHAIAGKKGAPAVVATAAVPSTLEASRTQMLSLINAERAQAGVGPLTRDDALDAIAQARSEDMIARNYFSHQIPRGGSQIPSGGMVFDILDHARLQYEMAGENIALNNYINFYPMTGTVQQTNTDLMNSPEHRANLLEPKYSRIGLGLAFEQGTGKLIVTEVFVQP